MNDTADAPATVETPHRPVLPYRRAAGGALMASGIVFFAAEFVTAAAWTDPPYSYTHHFISNLGVHGPTTAFGQFMYSPLAWVMNTGFCLFGFAALAGVLMLRGLPGRRRWAMVVPALLLAFGAVLVGLFPGSGDPDSGATDFHGIGAFVAFVCGNVLAVVLGRAHALLGVPRRLGRALVAAGIVGLVSVPVYLAVIDTGVLIGFFERGIVYPFLIGFVVLGAALRGRS